MTNTQLSIRNVLSFSVLVMEYIAYYVDVNYYYKS